MKSDNNNWKINRAQFYLAKRAITQFKFFRFHAKIKTLFNENLNIPARPQIMIKY